MSASKKLKSREPNVSMRKVSNVEQHCGRKASRKSLLSKENLVERNLHTDMNMLRSMLSKLMECAQAEKQWHVTHHNNIVYIAKALNTSMDQIDPSLPKVRVVSPTFFGPNDELDDSVKGDSKISKVESKDSDHVLTDLKSGTHNHTLSSRIVYAHRQGTLHSDTHLHAQLQSIRSADGFRMLDEKSFSLIFHLLCDWLFSLDVGIGDGVENAPAEEHSSGGKFSKGYHAFLLLYEGARFYPGVYLYPRYALLVKDVLQTLRNLYKNYSRLERIGLVPSDVSRLNNYLVRIIDEGR